jgi:Holliday junction resolvase
MQFGCVAYRVNNVGVWDEAKQIHRGGNTEKGLPDIWACIRGKFIVIEVKAGKDKMSEHQEARRQEIERAKGVYFVARSTDEFFKWFEILKS